MKAPTLKRGTAPRQEDGPRLDTHRTSHVLPLRASIFREIIKRLALTARTIVRRRQARYALGRLRRAGRSYCPQTEVAA